MSAFGQNCKNKEKKIQYTNGLEVFWICKTDSELSFDEKKNIIGLVNIRNCHKKYEIKSTYGGCGGALLNGTYRFYDNEHNLINEDHYSMGLKDGASMEWDTEGKIIAKSTYDKGDMIYTKYKVENKGWVEFIGKIFQPGTIKNSYTSTNILIASEVVQTDYLISRVKVYHDFPYNNQLAMEYLIDIG